jgi:ABC-2 type transport system permease protein
MGTSQGRASRTIAEKDLRQRIRDRTALLVGVLLPFALASILALTLGGAAEGDLDLDIGLVDLDGGAVADRFEQTLRAADVGTVHPLGDRDVAERRAEDGALDAVFVLPVGLSARSTSGGGGSIEVIGSPDSDLGPLVATSIARSFAARLDGIAIAVATASETPEDGPAIADAAAQLPPAASLDISVTADEGVTPSTFTAIGMAVFFLFFTVEFGIRSVIEEREQGTLARLLAAPIRPASVLIGKGLASFVVGVLSTGLLVVATTLLLDAAWGPLIGVALLVVTGVATAVAVTGFVATFATTSTQAGNYASVVAVVGGLLGGTFFPISQAPGLLASARFLSPQGWLMEGFTELSTGGGLVGALPALAGTLVIGVAFGTLAWVRARRMLSP